MQQQTFAIFGATTAAGTMICTRLATTKHKLLLSAVEQDPQTAWLAMDLQKLFPGADVEVANCALNAAWEADIIISAAPVQELANTCQKISSVACRKIFAVVTDAARKDITQLCQALLPHSKHINIITEWSGNRSVVFLQSEDDAALNRVADILDEAGITPVTANYNELARA